MQRRPSESVEANGIRLHYTRTGPRATPGEASAKPPLMLAHDVADDGLCWTSVARALETEYDVIMVDARGHGLSEAPESGYGPAEQAGDLAGVIRALGLRRPAILCHSMGAATTLALAGTYMVNSSGTTASRASPTKACISCMMALDRWRCLRTSAPR